MRNDKEVGNNPTLMLVYHLLLANDNQLFIPSVSMNTFSNRIHLNIKMKVYFRYHVIFYFVANYKDKAPVPVK